MGLGSYFDRCPKSANLNCILSCSYCARSSRVTGSKDMQYGYRWRIWNMSPKRSDTLERCYHYFHIEITVSSKRKMLLCDRRGSRNFFRYLFGEILSILMFFSAFYFRVRSSGLPVAFSEFPHQLSKISKYQKYLCK